MKFFNRIFGASLMGLVLFATATISHQKVQASEISSNTQAQSAIAQAVNYHNGTIDFFRISRDQEGDRVVKICKRPISQSETWVVTDQESAQEYCETLTENGLDSAQLSRVEFGLAWKLRLEKFAHPQNTDKIRAIHMAYFVLCQTGARYVFVDADQTRAVVDTILKVVQ